MANMFSKNPTPDLSNLAPDSGPPTFSQEHYRPVAVRHNDPLAGLTPKQIYADCIWISKEKTNTKIMLLCILRFMDKNLRSSSMSYAQIRTACSFSDSSAIRAANAARDRWLRIEVNKGRYVPGKGNENLYHGVIPPDVIAELRRQRAKGQSVIKDETVATVADGIIERVLRKHGDAGVSDSHPGEVSHSYPEDLRGVPQTPAGCPADTLTLQDSLKKKGAPTGSGVSDSYPGPIRAMDKAAMGAALNPEIAYAERNITVSVSGKLVIGDEFREELRQAFTEEEIDGGVDCTMAAMGTNRDKVRIIAQVRRQCTFRKQDAKTAATRAAAVTRRSGSPPPETFAR
jgi:hypothetical protein